MPADLFSITLSRQEFKQFGTVNFAQFKRALWAFVRQMHLTAAQESTGSVRIRFFSGDSGVIFLDKGAPVV